MIDFSGLEPLPLRRQKDALDRERLAAESLKKKAAKHRGRNHWRNWERRQMLAEKKRAAKAKTDKTMRARKAYNDQVRAYWRGERPDHPAVMIKMSR